jgi:hypothetical protein
VIGLGVRSTRPIDSYTGDQYVQWGYYDEENGFGFGIDSTGLYVFYRRDGSDTKIYRSNWSNDPMDGTGLSGYDVDPTELMIWQIDYTWYGAGEIAWYLNKRVEDFVSPRNNRQLLNVYDPVEDNNFQGPSLLQPDLPFTVEANNGSTTEDVGITVTGRAFRRLDQEGVLQRRSPVESIVDYSNLTQGAFEPVIGLTKKETYNGFPNQVDTRILGYDWVSTEDCTFRLRVGNNLIDRGSSTLENVDSWGEDSSVLIAKGDGIEVDPAVDGYVVSEKVIRGAGGSGQNSITRSGDNIQTSTPIGSIQDAVLEVRQDTGSSPEVSSTFKWSETF